MMQRLRGWIRNFKFKPVGVWILLSGGCMTLGFAPFGVWPLAIISLAVLMLVVRRASSPKQAAAAALVWGIGHGVSALYWLPWAFFKDSNGDWVETIAGGIPAMLGLALYCAVGYALAAWVARKNVKYAELIFVGMLVAMEMLRGTTPYGFPWLPIGAVWAAGSASMMQLAAVGGVYLLSALVLLMAVLVSTPTRARIATACVLAVAVWGYGTVKLLRAPPSHEGEMVRVVQPNVHSVDKWAGPFKRWEVLQRTLAVAEVGPKMPGTVVMPESAIAFFLNQEDDIRMAVAEHLQPGSKFVTGTVRREGGEVSGTTPRYYNSITVLDEVGTMRDTYDKVLLVPFGEVIPLHWLADRLPIKGIRTLSQSRLDFSYGTKSPLLNTPAGEAMGLICYEGIFPWHVARYARGAQYLINITNDNWFTGTIALYQHAALARLRAVENGLPLVRVANTGLTVVFDGYGRELARLPVDKTAAADVLVPGPAPFTPFGRIAGQL